jgi:hypothetical protein
MARRPTKPAPLRRSYQTKPNPETVYDYLDALKRSGSVSLWAMNAVVAEHFGCLMQDAREVVEAWRKDRMHTA